MGKVDSMQDGMTNFSKEMKTIINYKKLSDRNPRKEKQSRPNNTEKIMTMIEDRLIEIPQTEIQIEKQGGTWVVQQLGV